MGVQQLHNNMSTIIMQVKMGTRPMTKDDFTTKWNTMPEHMQQSATTLFERMKKHVGKGDISIPSSFLNVTGMPAFAVTGWDWRRQSVKKQLTREVLPSIQAIMVELEFATTYRPEVLSDPIVWALRSALSKNMSTNQYRTKLELKSANTGSQREWKFWDGVVVPKPTVKMDVSNEEDIQKAQFKTNRRIAAEKVDRDAILKVQKLIASLLIAHVSPDSKSPVAIEVAKATNDLTNVSLTITFHAHPSEVLTLYALTIDGGPSRAGSRWALLLGLLTNTFSGTFTQCISHTSSHLDWE
ncbi:hypothetical protein BDR04DRAFT_473903 [Suillus decipiens]|nr:hypothetical protein BDR04DRAFT_473903 [Suillus decipiens]